MPIKEILTMITTKLSEISITPPPRYQTGIGGFDNILGGGLVEGSTILASGERGVGKSTLLLQISNHLANANKKKILYVAGEENKEQIKMRAERLEINSENIYFLEEPTVENVVRALWIFKPDIIIIDSLQMLYSKKLKTSVGSPTQMRNGLHTLCNIARKENITIIFIGHATKGGFIAGLQTLQHEVDVVLYLGFDDEKARYLEAKKNRFGEITERWRFSMDTGGLKDLPEDYNNEEGTEIRLTPQIVNKMLKGHPVWTMLVNASLDFLQGEYKKQNGGKND